MKERLLCGWYSNANGITVAIVAVVNYRKDTGAMFDWAAYIGGSRLTEHQEDCVEEVARKGCKMTKKDAAHFFPGLDITRYRE